MALVSPGVEVTIIDESNYLPASTNSVPYILIATAQNKISGAGVGVAPGTLAANAGKVYLVTSQRDLAATFGTPFFYKTSAGTPINGYELNEYGLLAAHSVLGISNRAYVQRADVDLAELTATLVRPVGAPADGTYWLDTTQTSWGIFEFNNTTGLFTQKTPIVITDTANLDGGIPSQSVGAIGDYAVVTTNIHNPIYFKNTSNNWVLVGSDAWKNSWPTITGANSINGNSLPAGTLVFNTGSAPGGTVTIGALSSLEDLVNAINAAGIEGITAEAGASNQLLIYGDSRAISDGSSADGGIVVIESASTGALLVTLGLTAGTYLVPALQQSYSYQNPRWKAGQQQPRPTGSIWEQISPVNQGAEYVVKRYSATVGDFLVNECPLFTRGPTAIYSLDPAGGGRNIPVGTLFGLTDSLPELVSTDIGDWYNDTATTELYRFYASGQTVVAGDVANPTFTVGDTFVLSGTVPGSATASPQVTATIGGTGTPADFVAAVSAANVPYVSAAVNSDGTISLIHSQGGIIICYDTLGTPLVDAGFNFNIEGISEGPFGHFIISNYTALDYIAADSAPNVNPADGRNWYYSATNQVDIMIQDNGQWKGYRTVSNDVRSYNLTQTDPNGPIISASEPIQQSDQTPLVYGDLWVDTSNLEEYPILKRWQNVSGVDQWVTVINSDQTTSNGILFADARWADNGTTDPVADPFPTITSLLSSDYLDIDAPDATLYPEGMLLWNTRRSGFNVKAFQSGYFNAQTFPVDSYQALTPYAVGDKVLYNGIIYVCIAPTTNNTPGNIAYWAPLETNTWVTVSGNRADGSPYMGRKAVRQIVVQAMKRAIDTQDTLREEQQQFNLIACPQYPELIPNMVALNNERSNTAFIVGDTPLRLGPQGNDIVSWATNASGLGQGGEDGITISDPYLGVFYPSCQTTDLSGAQVVQPPSHMMLRTIVRSDEVAYPWLAPAGVRRGVIDNAERIGYVNAQTGEFTTIATGQGLRDVLYENKINPITFIPGVGITNYGNKTESAISSALDRINVARLVAFIRARLDQIGKQFVFEPNDQITRNEISNSINSLMVDLVAKRGIYDYLIVCDESNNTPARIDRNELYVDIAIEPVKAVEFIYIPVRIKNTGEIAAGQVASSASV